VTRALFSTSSGFGLAQYDVDAGLLGAFAIAPLGINATDQRQLALYQGRVNLTWGSQSGTNDCRINVLADSELALTGNAIQVFADTCNGVGHGNAQFCLPAAQCHIEITNANAAAKNVNWMLTAVDP
jgi:hypothetical protein